MVDLGVSSLAVSSYLELNAGLTGERAGFVFDRYGDESFKFVLVDAAADQLAIGHYTKKSGWVNDAVFATPIDAGAQNYRVILQSDAATIDASVARYGLTLRKRLKTGAVVEATREQLDALSADSSLGHIAGDTRVRSMMAVSAQATGADQVGAGTIAGLAAATGRGIGIAVIDSGVSNHRALQGRVVASFDFTQSSGVGIDGYGHGTHVAGIVAGSGSGRLAW